MTRNEMLERFKVFGVRIIKLTQAMPQNQASRAVALQVLRCGTSIGANYHEACHASSKRHFVTILGTSQREARETAYWLDLIAASDLLPAAKLTALTQECDELIAILTASIRTAKKKPVA